jgi:hypothetical protein
VERISIHECWKRRTTLTATLQQAQHDKAREASVIATLQKNIKRQAWPFEKVLL